MHKSLFALILAILSILLLNAKAYAYGPFVLPIHDNNVQINGGAWNYSVSCSAAQYEIDYAPSKASHGGYDFDGDEGDNVYAAASGVVSEIQNSNCPNTYPDGNPTWGCYVDIKHDVDGDGVYDYTTKYTHLVSGSITVAAGNSVSSNTIIGQLGNSGYSDGAHLHYGIQNYNWAQYLDHDYWLDPYNLDDDNATCCDIPNGCPNEGSSSQHSGFNCGVAGNSGFLWASCPPTYDAEVEDSSSSSGSSSRDSIIDTEFNSVFSTYNVRNQRTNACTGALEPPNFLLGNENGNLHWWNYSGSGDPNKSSYTRDTGKYETIIIQDYTSFIVHIFASTFQNI